MKKNILTIVITTFILGLLLIPTTVPALATTTQGNAGTKIKQGIIDTGVAAELGNANTDIREVVALIINALLGFLGILFTVLIIYGGFLWMTAAGNDQQIEKARKILTQATIGLLIVILAYALSSWIFRAILYATYQPY